MTISSRTAAGAATAANQTPTPTAGKSLQFTVTTTTTAVQLNSGTSFACSSIEIACDLDSPGYLCVGWAAGNLTASGFKVYQGQSVKIAISNVNLLWVDASASLSKGSWVAS